MDELKVPLEWPKEMKQEHPLSIDLCINTLKTAAAIHRHLHECAHHQTGDVDLPASPRNSPEYMMNESIADCIATLRIRDEIIGGEDVAIQAVEQLIKDMIKIGFPALTMESRKANILNCLQKTNQRMYL